MKSVTKNALAFVVLLLMLMLAYTGGRMALAGMADYQAQIFLKDWASKGQEPSPRAWAVAQAAAHRAVDLYPTPNGEYLDRLGRVYSWQQFTQPYGSPEAQASRQAALDSYRASTIARPTWPGTWARLAHAKLYLLEFDAEFQQAMSKAAQLGPWRIGINRELTEIGFTAWPQLNAAQREATLETARRAVAYSTNEAKRIYQLAQHTGMTDVLCESLDSELQVQRRICQ